MQPSRFVILTGHLKDYPLSDLVGILRHQRKTGRLLIEYPKGPAAFYFKDGELVDAQLHNLAGLQAVCVAVAQPPSSFNFNPLIQPPKRSIENSMQRVVSELLGCWDENGLEIEALSAPRSVDQPALAAQTAPQPALLAAAPSFNVSQTTRTDQALVFSSVALEVPKSNYSRPILAMAAAGLMMLGLSTVIALTRGFGRVAPPPVPAAVEKVDTTPERPVTATQSAVAPSVEIAAETPIKANSNGATQSIRKAAPNQTKQAETLRSTKSEPKANRDTERSQQKSNEVGPRVEPVKVILRIENGRVAQASIANHKPGMDAYEAMALRIARQRRYPAKATGPETVVIRVTPSN